jgi:sec-independent protein translocase protein TatA
MFGEIGIEKLILLFVIVLVMFGAKRLPEIGQGLGKGIREFKRATTGSLDEPSPGVFGMSEILSPTRENLLLSTRAATMGRGDSCRERLAEPDAYVSGQP